MNNSKIIDFSVDAVPGAPNMSSDAPRPHNWVLMAEAVDAMVQQLRTSLREAMINQAPRQERAVFDAVMNLLCSTSEKKLHACTWYGQEIVASVLFLAEDAIEDVIPDSTLDDAERVLCGQQYSSLPPFMVQSEVQSQIIGTLPEQYYVSAAERKLCTGLLLKIITNGEDLFLKTSKAMQALYPLLISEDKRAVGAPTAPSQSTIAESLLRKHPRFTMKRNFVSLLLNTLLFSKKDGIQSLIALLMFDDRIGHGATFEAAMHISTLVVRDQLSNPAVLQHDASKKCFKKVTLSQEEHVKGVSEQLGALLERLDDTFLDGQHLYGTVPSQQQQSLPAFLRRPQTKLVPHETLEDRLHLTLTLCLGKMVRLPPRPVNSSSMSAEEKNKERDYQLAYRRLYFTNKYFFGPYFGAVTMQKPHGANDIALLLRRMYSLARGASLTTANGIFLMVWDIAAGFYLDLVALGVRSLGLGGLEASSHPSWAMIRKLWETVASVSSRADELAYCFSEAIIRSYRINNTEASGSTQDVEGDRNRVRMAPKCALQWNGAHGTIESVLTSPPPKSFAEQMASAECRKPIAPNLSVDDTTYVDDSDTTSRSDTEKLVHRSSEGRLSTWTIRHSSVEVEEEEGQELHTPLSPYRETVGKDLTEFHETDQKQTNQSTPRLEALITLMKWTQRTAYFENFAHRFFRHFTRGVQSLVYGSGLASSRRAGEAAASISVASVSGVLSLIASFDIKSLCGIANLHEVMDTLLVLMTLCPLLYQQALVLLNNIFTSPADAWTSEAHLQFPKLHDQIVSAIRLIRSEERKAFFIRWECASNSPQLAPLEGLEQLDDTALSSLEKAASLCLGKTNATQGAKGSVDRSESVERVKRLLLDSLEQVEIQSTLKSRAPWATCIMQLGGHVDRLIVAAASERLRVGSANDEVAPRPTVLTPSEEERVIYQVLTAMAGADDVTVVGHAVRILARCAISRLVGLPSIASVVTWILLHNSKLTARGAAPRRTFSIAHDVLPTQVTPAEATMMFGFVMPTVASQHYLLVARLLDFLLAVCDEDEGGLTAKRLDDECLLKYKFPLVDILEDILVRSNPKDANESSLQSSGPRSPRSLQANKVYAMTCDIPAPAVPSNTFPIAVQVATLHLIGQLSVAAFPRVSLSRLCDMSTAVFRLAKHPMLRAASASMLWSVVTALAAKGTLMDLRDVDLEPVLLMGKHLSCYHSQPSPSGSARRIIIEGEADTSTSEHDEVVRFHGSLILKSLERFSKEQVGQSIRNGDDEAAASVAAAAWSNHPLNLWKSGNTVTASSCVSPFHKLANPN